MATDDTSPNWDVIKTDYITGGGSLRDLALKYGVHPDALMSKSNRGGWAAERTQIASMASEVATNTLVRSMAEQITESNMLDLRIAAGVKRLIYRHIQKAELTVDEQGEQILIDPGVLDRLISAADKAQKISQLALGAATAINEQNLAVKDLREEIAHLDVMQLKALKAKQMEIRALIKQQEAQ